MKKDEAIKMLNDALLTLYRDACQFEQDDTPRLSRALNKARKALERKLESRIV